jgi:ATP-dependent exoDNAse (exonuclease V) alpha subunit
MTPLRRKPCSPAGYRDTQSSPNQRRQVMAIRLALMSKVLVMTGGPGVGKTTIVKAILRILSAQRRAASARR